VGNRRIPAPLEGMDMRADLSAIGQYFLFEGDYLRAERLPSGHINDTYALFFRQTGGPVRRYLLQRINHHVFGNPEKLMGNIQGITSHLRKKIVAAGGDPARETINLIPTVEGRAFCQTPDGNYWRAAMFIEGARTYEIAENLDHVYNVAHAFGRFQKLVSDFPAEQLHETIPDFHHTPKRFAAFVEAVERDTTNRARCARAEIEFVEQRVSEMPILVDLLQQGKLPQRVTHNDTKFNNVMIDDSTGKGICVIDLDTVMPGLSLYDFGDAVRSGANPAAEDEQDLSKVTIDMRIFERFAGGYLDAARDFLTPLEIDYLAFSARLMTLECGMRFLTDYLNGDLYFRILRENHNLDRCRTQFKMVRAMEKEFDAMTGIVSRYWDDMPEHRPPAHDPTNCTFA
jgi:Ser/Thr protein kinase RdoA (MazF antagonist)